MIERFRVPFDQRKVFAIVLRMTAGAFLARSGRQVVTSVQAPAGQESRRDFSMTLETPQRCLPTELVTTGAVRGSVQRLVWTRERPRRNLRRRP